jgi:hypothetical protein
MMREELQRIGEPTQSRDMLHNMTWQSEFSTKFGMISTVGFNVSPHKFP